MNKNSEVKLDNKYVKSKFLHYFERSSSLLSNKDKNAILGFLKFYIVFNFLTIENINEIISNNNLGEKIEKLEDLPKITKDDITRVYNHLPAELLQFLIRKKEYAPKEKTQRFSIINRYKPLFPTRNFGSEIEREYRKEDIEATDLKTSIFLIKKLIHQSFSPNSVDFERDIRRIATRNGRIKRLTELDAPEIILENEKQLLQKAIDDLDEKYAKHVERKKLLDKQLKESLNHIDKKIDSITDSKPTKKESGFSLPIPYLISLSLSMSAFIICSFSLYINIFKAKTFFDPYLSLFWFFGSIGIGLMSLKGIFDWNNK